MRDITKFPHAQATVSCMTDLGLTVISRRHSAAMQEATLAFMEKYDRLPNWDNIFFRGGITTTDLTVEIWEGE